MTHSPAADKTTKQSYQMTYTSFAVDVLTLSTADVPNCCCSKSTALYWSNPPF